MMAVRAEARELVGVIAGPLRMGENVKAALARVAPAAGLGERRVREIWHSEAARSAPTRWTVSEIRRRILPAKT